MWKTFKDFVRLARRTYGLGSIGKAAMIVCDKLQQRGLSPIDVVCYINWADGDCLTTRKIAKQLNVDHSTIVRRLQNIREVWPYLFYFGPKIPRFDLRRSDRMKNGGTMGRLHHDPSDELESF